MRRKEVKRVRIVTFHAYLHTLLDVLKHALYALAPQLSYALLVCQASSSLLFQYSFLTLCWCARRPSAAAIHQGETVAAPFSGHLDWVMSVAFSLDGQHIVSRSEDQSISVWNAMTGETVAPPFSGHSKSVTSVTFSPDGQHVVSGSDDRTIRV